MNCFSCGIRVSSDFIVAISENRCPGCGDVLIEKSDFAKLALIRKEIKLLNLGLDNSTATKISAAISSKFLVTEINNTKTRKQKKNMGFPKQELELSLSEEDEFSEEDEISEEDENLIKEFGLDIETNLVQEPSTNLIDEKMFEQVSLGGISDSDIGVINQLNKRKVKQQGKPIRRIVD